MSPSAAKAIRVPSGLQSAVWPLIVSSNVNWRCAPVDTATTQNWPSTGTGNPYSSSSQRSRTYSTLRPSGEYTGFSWAYPASTSNGTTFPDLA